MLHLLRSPMLVAGLVVLPGCTCDEPAPVASPSPSSARSPEPACAPLPPIDAWVPITEEFFAARLPPSFREAAVKDGMGYRDEAAKRRIQFSEIGLPAAGMDVATAIDRLSEGVREQASDPALGLKLGPTRHGGTGVEPVRFFQVTGLDRTFLQGLVGRIDATGRLRAVLIIYEDDGSAATPLCMERDGRALMETVSIPGGGAASAGPVVPPLAFTARAVEELRRQLGPGETVWVGVNRDGAKLSYLIDVGIEVPPDSQKVVIEGIPVALDRGSVALLRGTTVDFVAGGGFKFDNPSLAQ